MTKEELTFYEVAANTAKKFEGFSSETYMCEAGRATIGYGCNLERVSFTPKVAEEIGRLVARHILDGGSIGSRWRGLRMPRDVAYCILIHDLKAFQAEIKSCPKLTWLEPFPVALKYVILDMVYNMGLTRFLSFKRAIAAMKSQNWNTAADEMLDSKWARQDGKRAKEHAETVRALPTQKKTVEERLEALEAKL